MISNLHEIDEITKLHHSIGKIENNNKIVFEAKHGIMPDIRLDYIANGPDDSSVQPDVYFSLPFTQPSWTGAGVLQRYEVKCSFENISANQWLFGYIDAPQQYTYGDFKYTSTNGQGVFITDMMPSYNYLSSNVISQSNTYLSLFSQTTSHINGGTIHDAGFFTTEEQYAQTYENEWVYCAGKPISTPLTTGIHTFSVGYAYNYYDGILSSNIRNATSTELVNRMYLFRGNASYGKCYSGVKIFYIKHFRTPQLVDAGTGAQLEIDALYVPVLHWDGTEYRPCFYDVISGNYSSYNLGNDNPIISRTSRDKILKYIGTGKMISGAVTSNTGYFNTGIKQCNSSFYGDKRIRCKFRTAGYSSVTNKNLLFGVNVSNPTFWCDRRNYSYINTHIIDLGNNTIGGNDRTWGYSIIDSSITSALIDPVLYNIKESIKILGVQKYQYTEDEGDNVDGGDDIFYLDISTANGHVPSATYVPILHNGVPCFYDYNAASYLTGNTDSTTVYQCAGTPISTGVTKF